MTGWHRLYLRLFIEKTRRALWRIVRIERSLNCVVRRTSVSQRAFRFGCGPPVFAFRVADSDAVRFLQGMEWRKRKTIPENKRKTNQWMERTHIYSFEWINVGCNLLFHSTRLLCPFSQSDWIKRKGNCNGKFNKPLFGRWKLLFLLSSL